MASASRKSKSEPFPLPFIRQLAKLVIELLERFKVNFARLCLYGGPAVNLIAADAHRITIRMFVFTSVDIHQFPALVFRQWSWFRRVLFQLRFQQFDLVVVLYSEFLHIHPMLGDRTCGASADHCGNSYAD